MGPDENKTAQASSGKESPPFDASQDTSWETVQRIADAQARYSGFTREVHGSKEIVPHRDTNDYTLYINTQTDNYPMHWHSEMEIIMPFKNIYTVLQGGTRIVLQPDDIIIIPSGVNHELISPSFGTRLIFQVGHRLVNEMDRIDSFYNRFLPVAVFRHDSGLAEHAQMIDCLKEIINEYELRAPLWKSAIHSKVLSFLVLASRICLKHAAVVTGTTGPISTRGHNEVFITVCSYIRDHCTDPLTLNDTAKLSGFSRSQFVRLFKDYTGQSFYEYLTRQRLVRADILLAEPEHSITEVAMHSGFNSLSTFNRVFRENHGCTPMEYRKRLHDGDFHAHENVHFSGDTPQNLFNF